MDRKSTVLIYSDRSRISRDLIERQLDANILAVLGVTMLNVDNSDVRRTVVDKLKVHSVPTLFVTYYGQQRPDVITGRDAIVDLIDSLLAKITTSQRLPDDDDDERGMIKTTTTTRQDKREGLYSRPDNAATTYMKSARTSSSSSSLRGSTSVMDTAREIQISRGD